MQLRKLSVNLFEPKRDVGTSTETRNKFLAILQARENRELQLLSCFNNIQDLNPVGWSVERRNRLRTSEKGSGFFPLSFLLLEVQEPLPEDIKVVQELLRHANARVTIHVYAQAMTFRMVLGNGEQGTHVH
jgi:hypothetical protein